MSNLVAIVGRPNVGKSTLFNRLTQTRHAIVSDEAGTTRDRQYGKCEWGKNEFSVVDTGGWVVNSDDIFEEEIRKQVQLATDEADVILFLVDGHNGVTDLDEAVAGILRRTKKPVILVCNKVDNNEVYLAAEFYSLGLGDPYCISAATGSGTGDLLDLIINTLPKNSEETHEENIPRFAVVGRPNAGKSSLINAFIGEDRHIVTDIAGTTRDSIYTRYDKFGFDFYLVDTAGIRKKNKVNEDLEFYSVMRSIRAIENSDVCILMIDATRGIESQDMNIFQLIQKNNKSLVVVINKWDLVEEKSTIVMKTFEEAIRERMAPFTDFPIVFSGDLLNQCVSANFALRELSIPFFGVYGACSTMVESMILSSMAIDGGFAKNVLCGASSHFCSAERQYRFPLSYGGQRTPTAQWTVTGAGGTVLSENQGTVRVTYATVGRVMDLGIKDVNNMGAAMAPVSVILTP